MRAICYLRELPAPSLETQQRAFLEFCEREGFEVGPTVTESRVPGEDASELRRLLRMLRSNDHGFTVVVVAELGVLGDRALAQLRRALQFDALGVPLRLADGADLDRALAAAWEHRTGAERRREHVRSAMRLRALRGEVLGRPPYGYRVAGRRLEPHPEESRVVREVFRLALREDLGVRRIAQQLNEHGIRTRRNQPWSMVSLRAMLRNPVYTGTYRRLDVVVPGAHDPLVSQTDFRATQQRLEHRRTSTAEQTRHRYLLAGLGHCGYCGNRLIGVTRERRTEGREAHVYYQCESRANHSRCGYHTRRADELESIVRERIAEALAASPRNGTHVAPAGNGVENGATEDGHLKARRASLRRELQRLVERRAAGQWTAAQLRRAAASVVLDDLEAETEVATVERERRRSVDVEQQRGALRRAARELVERWDALTFEQRRARLAGVVRDVVVTDEDVRVELAM